MHNLLLTKCFYQTQTQTLKAPCFIPSALHALHALHARCIREVHVRVQKFAEWGTKIAQQGHFDAGRHIIHARKLTPGCTTR